MFWDKNYTPSQNIEVLLEKENVTVEEFLDDDDIIQECKTSKKNIVNYFTRPEVIRRLVELIITEPPEDLPMVQRFRYANVACEILTLGLPSLDEKLLADADTLKTLYSYLEREPPLNPLLSSFFSKTFSMLFTKKPDQDWFLYQQMCLKLLEYIKSQKNFLDLICKHFSTPVIPDLITEMMKDVEGGQLKRNLYEWLNEDKLVERLIAIIGDPCESEKHANVAEFLCDLIQQGRTMRQSEQEDDCFEPAFDGSNPILKNIESAPTIEALLDVILEPNAPESAIISGITVVLKIIKPVVIVDERNSDRLKVLQDREKEIHEEILTTMVRVMEPRLKDFNELLRSPPKKPVIVTSAAKLSPPFGMTRLQICRLFTVLLQTNNEQILKAICETDFFETLMALFKQYCWNNFLHSEVEKCLQIVFYTQLANSNTNNSTLTSEGSNNKNGSSGDNVFDYIKSDDPNDVENEKKANTDDKSEGNMEQNGGALEEGKPNLEQSTESENVKENNDGTKAPIDTGPSALQEHVIVKCKLISKLIDCWKYNRDTESTEKGRRLGYMGHLIKIFKHVTTCISESEHIGALIENNLSDSAERELWQSIINPNDGDLTKALTTQSKLLANCKAHEACDYNISLDFLADNVLSDAFNGLCGYTDSTGNDIVFALDYNTQHDEENAKKEFHLFQFGSGNEDDDDDDEENATAGDSLPTYSKTTSLLPPFCVGSNAWEAPNDFDVLKGNSSNTTPWTTDFNADNFADFDAHFSSFANDMGESLTATTGTNTSSTQKRTPLAVLEGKKSEESDNNANAEKSSWGGDFSAFTLKKDTEKMQFGTCDFDDDYDDDEGMWTKPLGGSTTLGETNAPEEQCDARQTGDNVEVLNGPKKKEERQKTSEELNKSNEDNTLIATAHITAATNNEKTESHSLSNDTNHEMSGNKLYQNSLCTTAQAAEKLSGCVVGETTIAKPNTPTAT